MLYVNVLKTDEEKRRANTNYKYLITSGAYSYTAYETDEGFKRFLKRNKMKLLVHQKYQNSVTYKLNKDIEERSFWKLSDIENIDNCISYYNLSNGSLVTCYSEVRDDKVINYRPNPNAKKVYNPLPTKAHIEYQKKYG
jgi:hypothetical protein